MSNLLVPTIGGLPFSGTDYNANLDKIENGLTDLGPYVISGLVPSIGGGLSVNVTAGSASIGGRVTIAAGFAIGGLVDNTVNHLFVMQAGTGTANTTGTPPALSVKIGTATTSGGVVTSVNTLRSSGRQLLVRPDALVPGAVGSPGSINLAGWAAAAGDNVPVYGTLPSGAMGLAANVALTDRDPQIFTGQNLFTRTALATANSGTVSVGAGGFAGGGGTNFAGSAAGTQVAVNAASGFTGSLLDLQVAGVRQLSVTKDGYLNGQQDLRFQFAGNTALRVVRAGTWADSTTASFFQAGDAYLMYTGLAGALLARTAFTTLSTQFSSLSHATVPIPIGFVEILPAAAESARKLLLIKMATSQTGNALEVQPQGSTTPVFALTPAGHLISGGSAPTAAAGSNAGTSPPAPVVTGGANDVRGNSTWGTGTGPAAGNQVVVTFATAYAAAPTVMVVPKNALTAALVPYVTSVSTTQFTFATQAAPAASQANTVYAFDWVVVQ